MLTPEREDGFTLVELLLTVVLLGVVGSAIASSMLVMLSTKKSAEGMLAVSQDRQFVTSWFSDDVAGARSIATGTQPVCGTPQSTAVVFTGTDVDPGTTSGTATTVAWTYVSASKELRRTSCRGAGPAEVRTLARNVDAAPTVGGSCSGSGPLTSTPPPAQVRLTVPQAGGAPLVLCALRRPE